MKFLFSILCGNAGVAKSIKVEVIRDSVLALGAKHPNSSLSNEAQKADEVLRAIYWLSAFAGSNPAPRIILQTFLNRRHFL